MPSPRSRFGLAGALLDAAVKALQEKQALQESLLQKHQEVIEELQKQALQDSLLQKHQKVIEELQKQLQKHQEVIDELQKRLQATEERLGLGQLNSMDTKVDMNPTSSSPSQASRYTANEEDVATYEFNQSMWDALLLLFCGKASYSEFAILSMGGILNLGLQFLILIVINFNMLGNPYDETRVEQMMRWRVDTGQSHHLFDMKTGTSLADKLCSRSLWSFEQMEYKQMYDYLYKGVPGWMLSILAIIVWVFTIIVEYRKTMEQALAIFHLPSSKRINNIHSRGAGEYAITGIHPVMRYLALGLLCFPRLVVSSLLCGVGCRYLAETASLADIVLNAMALGFVLEVDELLAMVLLSEKLRYVLSKLQPMRCTNQPWRQCGSCSRKDLIRYLLTVGMIVFAAVQWLVPFDGNVRSAANALCGGYTDFAFQGGIEGEARVSLMNQSDFVYKCEGGTRLSYMSRHYGINFNTTRATTSDDVDYETRRLSAVLSYAFKGCDAGQLRSPRGICQDVPSTLAKLLPEAVTPGANVDPEECQRFDTSLGTSACTLEPHPETCTWTMQSYVCEDYSLSPGQVFKTACGTELDQSCEIWEGLGLLHPSKHCRATRICPPHHPDCVVMRGKLLLVLGNASAFTENSAVTEAAVQAGLMNVTSMGADSVEVELLSSTPRPASGRGLSGSLADGDTAFVYYRLIEMPVTLLPRNILASGSMIVQEVNSQLFTALGSKDTVSSASFADPEYISIIQQLEEDKELEKQLRLERQQQQQQVAAETTAQEANSSTSNSTGSAGQGQGQGAGSRPRPGSEPPP